MGENDVKIVCRSCGGYGVTILPGAGKSLKKQDCFSCDKRGWKWAECWNSWEPNPDTLKWVEGLEKM